MPYLTLSTRGDHAWASTDDWLTSKSEFLVYVCPHLDREVRAYGYRRVWRCLRCGCSALGGEILSEYEVKEASGSRPFSLRAGPGSRDWTGEPTCSGFLRYLMAGSVLES